MASKEVIDRARSTETAVSMLNTYAEQVQEGASVALSPFLQEGEVMPDLGLTLRLLARMLAARKRDALDADRANERERADDAAPRAKRDGQAERVFDLVVTVRDAAGILFGKTGQVALGLSEPCPGPSMPDRTARYASALVGALTDDDVVLPPPTTRSLPFHRADFAEELQAELAPLEDAIRVVNSEESELKGTQANKDEALAANDESFSIATGFARYVFRLCGLTDLADKIRESVRRPGRLETPQPADGPSVDVS